MNHAEAKQFLDFALRKIQASSWTTTEAAEEMVKMYDFEQEKAIWREQAREEGVFGRIYL